MDAVVISLFSFLISLEFAVVVFIAFMLNYSIILVPHNSVSVVERFRKFQSSLKPGLNFVFPFIDKVVVNLSLKEQLLHIPMQSALTKDKISIKAEGVLHYKILNSYKANYNVEDYKSALTQLARSIFRAELSKLELHCSYTDPESLAVNIIDSLNEVSKPWGILILSYEIQEISIPLGVLDEMEGRMRMKMRAERDKAVLITESEARKQSAIKIAEGKKQVQILAAQAKKISSSLEAGDRGTKELKKVEDIFSQVVSSPASKRHKRNDR